MSEKYVNVNWKNNPHDSTSVNLIIILLRKMIVIILTKDNGDDSEDRHKNNTAKNEDDNDNIFWKEYLTQRQDYDLMVNGKSEKIKYRRF